MVAIASILGQRNLWFRASGWRETGQQKRVSVLREKLARMISSVLSGFRFPYF